MMRNKNFKFKTPKSNIDTVSWYKYFYKPTGKFETILNLNWKWWKFWVNKYVAQEIVVCEKIRISSETKTYEVGSIVL